MFCSRIDDIPDNFYTDNDIALVLKYWEMKELKLILDEWVKSHSIMQSPTAAYIAKTIGSELKFIDEDESDEGDL